MFLILLHYTKPLSEVDRVVPAHREFLKRCYHSGHFLLSGRQEPRTGGVILARAANRSEVEALIKDDPFNREGVAEYEIIEFVPTMAAETLASLLETK